MNDGIMLANGTVVVGSEFTPLDLEVVGEETIDQLFKTFLKGLPVNVLARVELRTEEYSIDETSRCSRAEALRTLQSTKYVARITLEKKVVNIKELVER